jgi:hypothetical protein
MFCAATFVFALGSSCFARPQQASGSPPTFESLLTEMSPGPGDSCNAKGDDFSRLEYRLFERADDAVVQALNYSSTAIPGSPNYSPSAPKAQALDALTTLQHLSAEINKSWPEENRFQFAILEISPVIVVKMTFRNRATFTVFAIPKLDANNKPNIRWEPVYGIDSGRFDPISGYDSLDLFPLHRSHSNKARFLAKFVTAGCGSGVGISFYAYEWSPDEWGELNEVIKLQGAVTQEDPIDKNHPSKNGLSGSFPPIGTLQTNGLLITLPYCWFSEIDTWDNPSLCAADSYDLTRDHVRFVRRVTNRPDLVPVARAIQYAQARDYPAVLAYCGSPQVALQVVSDVPAAIYAGSELKVTRIGATKERVELGDFDKIFRFDVEKRNNRWLVVAIQIK